MGTVETASELFGGGKAGQVAALAKAGVSRDTVERTFGIDLTGTVSSPWKGPLLEAILPGETLSDVFSKFSTRSRGTSRSWGEPIKKAAGKKKKIYRGTSDLENTDDTSIDSSPTDAHSSYIPKDQEFIFVTNIANPEGTSLAQIKKETTRYRSNRVQLQIKAPLEQLYY